MLSSFENKKQKTLLIGLRSRIRLLAGNFNIFLNNLSCQVHHINGANNFRFLRSFCARKNEKSSLYQPLSNYLELSDAAPDPHNWLDTTWLL